MASSELQEGGYGFVMEHSLKFKARKSEEQSSSGVKKANWGNDLIFGTYGLSENSSSSGLSSPFGSELGSTESSNESGSQEDEDFIAELSRQMADYMLKDEEEVVSVEDNDSEENTVPNTVQATNPCGVEICYYNQESYVPMTDSALQMKTGFYSSDDLKRPIHVYNLKDQPTTLKQNNMQTTSTLKQTLGGHIHYPILSSGAGMRAVFLGGPGSFGTGVFLPRSVNPTTTAPKKKSGSSTVLIPARVLQALQLHYNHINVLSQSHTCHVSPSQPPKYDANTEPEEYLFFKESQHLEENQTMPESVLNDQEMQLPQEWTY